MTTKKDYFGIFRRLAYLHSARFGCAMHHTVGAIAPFCDAEHMIAQHA
jgi:hypothetical protein